MNAESLSREALESLKRMPRDDSAEPDTSLHNQVVERPAKKERPVRRSQIIPAVTSEDQMHFRPQRLSEVHSRPSNNSDPPQSRKVLLLPSFRNAENAIGTEHATQLRSIRSPFCAALLSRLVFIFLEKQRLGPLWT